MNVDEIKTDYTTRILAIFARLLAEAKKYGFIVTDEPDEVPGDEEHGWWMTTSKGDRNFGLTFTIIEEKVREGDGSGINFGLTVVADGGRIVTDIIPYNFTPSVWVNPATPEAVEQRFKEIENACDPEAIVYEINQACSWERDGDGQPKARPKRSGVSLDRAIKRKAKAIGWVRDFYSATRTYRRHETDYLKACEALHADLFALKLPRWALSEVYGYKQAMFDVMLNDWFDLWHCEAGEWKPSKEVKQHSAVDKSARVWKGTRKVFSAWAVSHEIGAKSQNLLDIKEV